AFRRSFKERLETPSIRVLERGSVSVKHLVEVLETSRFSPLVDVHSAPLLGAGLYSVPIGRALILGPQTKLQRHRTPGEAAVRNPEFSSLVGLPLGDVSKVDTEVHQGAAYRHCILAVPRRCQ